MNLRPWQIFIFSLVPLALVFAGVIIGSLRGIDARREDFTTPTSTPRPGSFVPAPQQDVGLIGADGLPYL